MVRVLPSTDFTTSPWKNGGGITHEIARSDAPNGGWRWRLSIAEVATNGPFSRFPGMSRILTVIEGNGIDLHSADGILSARLYEQVAFSGDTAVQSTLVDGPIRDFNVIYDATLCVADVKHWTGPCSLQPDDDLFGFLCLAGKAQAGGQDIPAGAFALGHRDRLDISQSAFGLLVTLRDIA